MRKMAMAALVGMLLIGCTRVDPGHVGIKVNYYGQQRGVEDFPTIQGFVWYNPISTRVFQYPNSVQTAVWTHSVNEGSPVNEEITFNSKEGLVFAADISLSYTLKSENVPHFYLKFRSDDLNLFTHGFMRNVARDAFGEIATRYTADEIYGEKKEELISAVWTRMNSELSGVGVKIEQFGIIGAPRAPQNVVDAINMKIKATQDAIASENRVRSAKAEAQQSIAAAEGRAKSVLIEAEAQSKANVLLSNSLSPQLIQQKAIDRWNGVRPLVEGSGQGLLLNIPVGK